MVATTNSVAEHHESEELRQFREEWKQEVKRRKDGIAPAAADPASSVMPQQGSSTNSFPTFTSPPPPLPRPAAPKRLLPVTNVPTLSENASSAVATYRQAVVHEQHGELEQALELYRAAFRRDPNVDRLYEREEMLGGILAQQIASISSSNNGHTHDPQATPNGIALDDLSKQVENSLAVQDLISKHTLKVDEHHARSLTSVLHTFPHQLVFEPEDEREPVPLNILPDELIIHILKILDTTSLEKFAVVNRRARVVSLDNGIWKKLVHETYRPPQIPALFDGQSFLEYLSEQYLYDFRKLYIEHPRIRLDGVYIAVCHYIRAGFSDNAWVNVNHLITYHRYLRFFPNGQVISLLTNEEQPPAQVIPLLKPSLRGVKGLFFGNWHLGGNIVILSNLIDASKPFSGLDFSDPETVVGLLKKQRAAATSAAASSSSLSSSHAHGSEPIPSVRYIFTMNLTLLSRPLGRWNKMDIVSYDSVNLETGDASPVALKHERPFWFSKVRSYGP
ncbi:hypothetical protein D9757_005728 [Collybiopsis confluens]|uniref:F-box domain-containing protein n=1 Tax=Collybiopsis confluens TaxID=2823264 RepID=A0A8H5MB32_9AGAR|nr:hypothetical protein D9757_005728 [Collybiopsis confluens]